MAFPTGWGRKQTITIDNTKVSGSGSHTNLPVLITLDHLDSEIVDAGSNSALNGGGDLRFSSDSAGTTQLSLDVVSFVTNATPGSRSCELWVKVPSVSTSVDTIIYVWYKKAAETQPAVGASFGRYSVWTDYDYVSHDGSKTESSNGYTVIADGSGNYISTSPWGAATDSPHRRLSDASAVNNTTNFTLQAWHNGRENGTLICRRDGGTRQYQFLLTGGRYEFLTTGFTNVAATVVAPSGWAQVSAVVHSPTNIDWYVNGVAKTAGVNRVSITAQAAVPFRVGYRGNGGLGTLGYAYTGTMGETRVRIGVLTGDWLATEYNSQNSPSTFATAGTPGDVGGGGDITALITGVSSTGSIGSLLVASDAVFSVTGVQSTGAAGGLSVVTGGNQSITLSGLTSVGSAGTLTAVINSAVSLTGALSPGSVGGLTVLTGSSVSTSLTGVSTVGAVGSLVIQAGALITLPGVESIGAAGDLAIPQDTFATITGVTSSGAVGDLTVSLTGQWVIQPQEGGTWTLQPPATGIWTKQ